ncbi:MAG: glutaredoxin 3 [Bacillota bacterium]
MTEKDNHNIEIYTLEWCPYCRKAKSFLKSKGFTYKEYDIGEDRIKNEMVKRTDGAKTVPQIFIDEELIGGYDDLIERKKSGELDDILGIDSEKNFRKNWDVIIVGAGPAGLSSALYTARKGLEVLIISSDLGGQMVDTGEVGNYLGMIDVTGPGLMEAFWNHIKEYEINLELGETVADIEKNNEKSFTIATESGYQVQTRAVIIASGTTNRELGVPGEKEFKGKGVHYCATCDGFMYEGEPVAIIGGGNAGLEASLDLAQLDCEVDLIEVQENLTGDQILQDKVYASDSINIYTGHGVDEIKGKEKVNSLVIKDIENDMSKELRVNGVFIEIGLLPNTEFIKEKVEVNDFNEILVNENNETSIKGIWAAGDVTNIKDKQIIIAAGEGAKTALRVNEYLKD